MIKYFELLLELLDIEDVVREKYIFIAKKIETIWKNTDTYSSIRCYHRHAFIFEWYQKLINNEITTEDFIQTWDIKSKIFFDTQKQDSISFLNSNPKLDNNTLYVFDKISEWIIEKKENTIYC